MRFTRRHGASRQRIDRIPGWHQGRAAYAGCPCRCAGKCRFVILSGYDERVFDHDEEWKRNRDLEQILSTMQLDGSVSFEPLSTE